MALPIIGIVIPCYGHSQFLAEAVISACEQDYAAEIKVIVVDDGCRFEETGKVVEGLMASYPGILHYLRQENTRLPGARNTGVRFLLNLYPDIDSIYFLDADNRLAPYSIGAFRRALGDEPKVGWAYPDIAMFGLSSQEEGFDIRETAPVYSPLKHLIGNISEAGSLVRADMFRAGVFYDETMTSGFEDWDFWLSALEAGFVGVRARSSGFMYRRRPESMLADSRRLEETLIEGMRRTHASLFQPRSLMAREHSEAPVFAIYVAGADKVLLTSDPTVKPNEASLESFHKLLANWLYDDREVFAPDYLIIVTKGQWRRLQEPDRFRRWLWWRIKEFKRPAALVYERRAADHWSIVTARGFNPEENGFFKPSMLVYSMRALRPAMREFARGNDKADLPEFAQIFHFSLKDGPSAEPGKTAEFETKLERITRDFLKGLPKDHVRVTHRHRRYSGPGSSGLQPVLMEPICAAEGRAPLPVCTSKPRVTFGLDPDSLQDSVQWEGLLQTLEQFSKAGWEIQLLIERVPQADFSTFDVNALSLADDIIPIQLTQGDLEHRMYLGRRVKTRLASTQQEDFAVLCRTSDLFISFGVTSGIEAFGQVKSASTKTMVWLVADDVAGQGQENAKILAYEHATGSVVCDNEARGELLASEGFPPSKILSSDMFWKSQETG